MAGDRKPSIAMPKKRGGRESMVGGIGVKIVDAYETSFGPQQISGKIHCPR